jgi:hypothetical protein
MVFTKLGFGVFAGGFAARKHPKNLFFHSTDGKDPGLSYFVKTLTRFQAGLDNLSISVYNV